VYSFSSSAKEKEKLLRAFSERMLIVVTAKFGKDTEEQYQKADGTKKSERKKHKRKIAKVAI
jgi:hypothetical protein